MIFLTKKDSEKTVFVLNHRNIIKIDPVMNDTSNLLMADGKIFSVLESEDEIREKAMEYDINIVAQALKRVK